jgi:predicted secreted protein
MSNIFKVNDTYQIKLVDNPTTGFTWVYKCNNLNTTHEITREIISNSNLMGSGSTLIITFQSTKSDTLKFYHIREWLHPNLNDLLPNFIYDITIE